MLRNLNVRIKNMARWESDSVKMLGVIEIILGISLLVPALIALVYGEDPALFLYPVPILLILGTVQYTLFKSRDTLNPASGLMMIFIAWWVAFLVSAIPFYLYGFSFVDSLFEGVSGFTTTGASVIGDVPLPNSMIFWRSFSQWAGGISVVLIFLFLIPMMGIGGKAFVNNELAGSDVHNFSMKIKNSAKNFISIYVLLSVVEALLLIVSGLDPFDSVTMMFSTISTGGFMAGGMSSMAEHTFAVQVIVLAFMFLGGTNFYLHYRALKKMELSAYWKSQEFVWTVIWFLTAAVAIMVILIAHADDFAVLENSETVWNSVFTAVSMGTTTGYVITDQAFWPFAAYLVMWMLMLFGSMSGSTSGGIKMYRLLILKSYVTIGIYKMFHPRSVRDVKMDGHSVGDDAVVSATVVMMMFILTFIVSTIVLMVIEPGMNISESMGLSVSAISTTGVNTGNVTFAELNDISKIFLSFLMWVGRLEVVIALLLFTKTFWKGLASDIRAGSRATRGKKY